MAGRTSNTALIAGALGNAGKSTSTKSSSPTSSSSVVKKSSDLGSSSTNTKDLRVSTKGHGTKSNNGIANSSLSNAEKYSLAVNKAQDLMSDTDKSKYQIASRLGKTTKQIDKMDETNLFKDLIDDIYEKDYEATNTGREVRGENAWTDFVNGFDTTLNKVNTGIGSGIDWLVDTVGGGAADLVGLNGDHVRNATTGEDFAFIPDLMEDLALAAIPGAGIGLVVGKNALQNADNFAAGTSGYDPITMEKLSGGEQATKMGAGIFNTALSALPAVGRIGNAVRGATKATKAATEAEKSIQDTLKEASVLSKDEAAAAKAGSEAAEGAGARAASDQSLIEGPKLLEPGKADAETGAEYIAENAERSAQEASESPDAAKDAMRAWRIRTDETPVPEEQSIVPTEGTKAISPYEEVTRGEQNLHNYENALSNGVNAEDVIQSTLEDVNRSKSVQSQLDEITKLVSENYDYLNPDQAGRVAAAILNAGTTASDALAMSSLNALGEAGKYGGKTFGQALANNARNLASPITTRAKAMRDRTKRLFSEEDEKALAEDIEKAETGTPEDAAKATEDQAKIESRARQAGASEEEIAEAEERANAEAAQTAEKTTSEAAEAEAGEAEAAETAGNAEKSIEKANEERVEAAAKNAREEAAAKGKSGRALERAENKARKEEYKAIQEEAKAEEGPSAIRQFYRAMRGQDPETGAPVLSEGEAAAARMSQENLMQDALRNAQYGNNPVSRMLNKNVLNRNTRKWNKGKTAAQEIEKDVAEAQGKATTELRQFGRISEETQKSLDDALKAQDQTMTSNAGLAQLLNDMQGGASGMASNFVNKTGSFITGEALNNAAAYNETPMDYLANDWGNDVSENPAALTGTFLRMLAPGSKRASKSGYSPIRGYANKARPSSAMGNAAMRAAQGSSPNSMKPETQAQNGEWSPEEYAQLIQQYLPQYRQVSA